MRGTFGLLALIPARNACQLCPLAVGSAPADAPPELAAPWGFFI